MCTCKHTYTQPYTYKYTQTCLSEGMRALGCCSCTICEECFQYKIIHICRNCKHVCVRVLCERVKGVSKCVRLREIKVYLCLCAICVCVYVSVGITINSFDESTTKASRKKTSFRGAANTSCLCVLCMCQCVCVYVFVRV